tara:strand:- start:15 stop:188 length:174 start_codon:yes stop_codon:yes gene_type:complete
MKTDYSIREILEAINDLQNIKKTKDSNLNKKNPVQKDFSAVPKDTLKLIEEAEKNKY